MPAADRTGYLTIITDAIVHAIVHDPKTGRATGVRVIDANTKKGMTYEAQIIFSCASTIGTAQILLNSATDAAPQGLGNSSGMLGKNLMDHIFDLPTIGILPNGPDTYYVGRRPSGIYIPRFRNLSEQGQDYVRGYGYQGAVMRVGWRQQALAVPGIGTDLKDRARKLGPWVVFINGFGEMLPNPENRVTLHRTKTDKWGIPLVHIDWAQGDNERNSTTQILADGRARVDAAGGMVIKEGEKPGKPGLGIHEMGTACMGKDPKSSVLNKYNQLHDVPNLFVTDGAAMASSGCQNPSLTYMALSARAAHNATQLLKEGAL